MLSWAITFLIIAIVAAVLGFGGIAGAATGIAKILFIIFLCCSWCPSSLVAAVGAEYEHNARQSPGCRPDHGRQRSGNGGQ